MDNIIKLKIFICWSGDCSKAIAQMVYEFLDDIFNGDAFIFYSENIPAGERWAEYLSREVRDSDFGILCLTPENLDSNWIHFEAGALSKQKDRSLVVPLLFDVNHSDVRSPLSIFQGVRADKEENIRNLIEKINSSLDNKNRRNRRRLDRAINLSWPKVIRDSNDLLRGLRQDKSSKEDIDPLEELEDESFSQKGSSALEEVLGLVRGMNNEIIFLKDELQKYQDKLLKIFSVLTVTSENVDKNREEMINLRDDVLDIKKNNLTIENLDKDRHDKVDFEIPINEKIEYVNSQKIASQLVDISKSSSLKFWKKFKDIDENKTSINKEYILNWISDNWEQEKMIDDAYDLLDQCPDEIKYYKSIIKNLVDFL